MKKYRRMNWTDRLRIEALYNAGHTYRFIADQIGFSVAAVHREVKRGLYDHWNSELYGYIKKYSAQVAHEDAAYQATSKGSSIKLGNNHAYAHYVANRIKQGESPDVIVNTLKQSGEWTVSTPTLYRYIDFGYIPGITNRNLREKPFRKRRYKRIQKAAKASRGTSIEQRPPQINDRSSFGHWEMDSIIGKAKGEKESFLTLTERMTRYEIVLRVKEKTSAATVRALDRIIPKFPEGTFQSITVDNGCEFQDTYGMEHDRKGNRRLTVYYCHPYRSSERGSNERANRLLRRYFPKGQSLSKRTQKECNNAADAINSMPRRILGYRTPADLFAIETAALARLGSERSEDLNRASAAP